METSKHQTDEQVQCNPAEAIPLRYEPLDNRGQHPSSKESSPEVELCYARSDSDPVQQVSLWKPNSWQVLSKALLLLKAAKGYYRLGEAIKEEENSLGQSLRYANLGIKCYCKYLSYCMSFLTLL